MRVKAIGMSLVAWLMLPLLSVSSLAAAQDHRLADTVKNRDEQGARALLAKKADVNVPQADGATALHWAAHWNDLATADLLLKAGAKVNVANDYGVAPLLLASINGSGPMIQKLLKAGANPNAAVPTTGMTPLMAAARSGKVDAVKALLIAGANVEAQESTARQTPLMWAAAENHTEVVRLLLETGAKVSARSTAGHTPLLFAARRGDIETTKVLLAAGAKIDEYATNGMTALVVAVCRGYIAYATYLLDQGANPNMGPGFTPLHWASGEWGGYGAADLGVLNEDSEWMPLGGLRGQAKLDFVKVLLAHGANVNMRAASGPSYRGGGGPLTENPRFRGALGGATPFVMAAKACDVPLMRLLLANGADPQIKTFYHTTALMLASGLFTPPGTSRATLEEVLATMALLVDELKVDVNAVNDAGESALHGASYQDQLPRAQFLVEHGAKLNLKDKMGWTPLTVAEGVYDGIPHESVEIAAFLRKMGAEPTPPGIELDKTVPLGGVQPVNDGSAGTSPPPQR